MLRWGFARGIWLLFVFVRLTYAVLSNRTIDDQRGDSVTGAMPSYVGPWNYGPNCEDCVIHPDPSQCFDRTWHEVSVYGPTPLQYVNFTFVGTAVYVFAIIPNNTQDPWTTANLTFTMNNELVATFLRLNTSTVYEYNVPVYVNESMPNDQYTLQIEPQWGTELSYFAFDYAIYTFDDAPMSSSGTISSMTSVPASTQSSAPSSTATSAPKKPSYIGAIVGGAIGGVAAITILALVVFCLRRQSHGDLDLIRQARRGHDSTIAQDSKDAVVEPFHTQMSQDAFTAHPSLASPLRPPSPVGSVGRSSIAENVPQRQQLVRQVREMERTVTTLKARRGEEPSSPSRSSAAWSGDRWSTDEALRAQLETLQLEMERLKAVQEEAMAPPPAY